MFDPYDPEFLANRHPGYRWLRDEAPVLEVKFSGRPVWVVSRYEDVARVVRDPAMRVKPQGRKDAPRHFEGGPAATLWLNQVVLSDPPDHTRLRKLAMPAFRAEHLRRLEARVAASISARLDELARRNTIDLVADFAAFVPATTILYILDIPDRDWGPLLSRVPDFLNIFSPFPLDPAAAARTNEACAFYIDYFGALVDERAKAPKDDIVGALITAHDADDRLSRIELIAMLQTFLNAGYETTMSALGSGVHGLLSQPDAARALASDPYGLAEPMFDELLRWEAPVHFVTRIAPEDVILSGGVVPAGATILLALASANRDERRFAEPDLIDPRRTDREHMTFGGGRHFCLGAQLARMEARLALAALFERFPRLALRGDPPARHQNLLFPALTALPVVLEPTSPPQGKPGLREDLGHGIH